MLAAGKPPDGAGGGFRQAAADGTQEGQKACLLPCTSIRESSAASSVGWTCRRKAATAFASRLRCVSCHGSSVLPSPPHSEGRQSAPPDSPPPKSPPRAPQQCRHRLHITSSSTAATKPRPPPPWHGFTPTDIHDPLPRDSPKADGRHRFRRVRVCMRACARACTCKCFRKRPSQATTEQP